MDKLVSIEEALACCLDAVLRDETELEAYLRRYPRYRGELLPLMQVAGKITLALGRFSPLSEGRQAVAGGSGRKASRVRGPLSSAVHAFVRRRPLLACSVLSFIFSLSALFAWLPAVGSVLFLKEVSPILGAPLLILTFSLLPCFLLYTIFRSTMEWLRSLIFSPAFPSSSSYLRASTGLLDGLRAAVKGGWDSQDTVIRLGHRIVAWSALRVAAFVVVFQWATPIVR